MTLSCTLGFGTTACLSKIPCYIRHAWYKDKS